MRLPVRQQQRREYIIDRLRSGRENRQTKSFDPTEQSKRSGVNGRQHGGTEGTRQQRKRVKQSDLQTAEEAPLPETETGCST